MNQIMYVNGVPYVNSAEFVKLTLNHPSNINPTPTVYTFSSSYKTETIGGVNYTPLGGMLQISNQQRDLRVTSFDTAITLAGVDQDNIFIVLSSDNLIKGSLIQFYRGFYDSEYVLQSTVLRYTGVITSYTIQENIEMDKHQDTFTVTVNCSNYKTVLENRNSGRTTNPTSWKQFSASDTSMDNVPNLINAVFDFGKKVGT